MTKREWTKEHSDELDRHFGEGLMDTDTSAREAKAMSDKFANLTDACFNRNYYKRRRIFEEDNDRNAGNAPPSSE